MLHSIGRSPQRPDDIVDLLLACHGRIRSFLGLAIAIGEHTTASLSDITESAARVERYFSVALPLHVQDEEESVLPRLEGRSPQLDADLERMQSQHDAHLAPLRAMLTTCRYLGAAPESETLRTNLAEFARRVRTEFEPHLDAEERIIFPALITFVSMDERAAMVRELRERRRAP